MLMIIAVITIFASEFYEKCECHEGSQERKRKRRHRAMAQRSCRSNLLFFSLTNRL